jgi:protein-S-isoprenylcysteine O-methyltransferase Ste14
MGAKETFYMQTFESLPARTRTCRAQILLCNPLSTMAFAYISYNFFKDRIPYEEYFLCQYFPDYPEYRKRVPTRIPGIP